MSVLDMILFIVILTNIVLSVMNKNTHAGLGWACAIFLLLNGIII